jgi:uncharacterized protein
MPLSIILIIIVFLIGIIFDHLQIGKRSLAILVLKDDHSLQKIRAALYQIVVVYLLFKIGFAGGSELVGQSWNMIVGPGIVVIIASSLWTLFVLFLLNRWSSFHPITQISIAAHFGSVSVGTFIAGMAFLDGMGIYVNPGVAIWLALMELPAVLIGMWALGARVSTLGHILKEEWSLAILPLSILMGALIGNLIPGNVKTFIFGVLFMPMLLYFLFEMGRKASSSLHKLKGKIGSTIFVGIAIPILGGIWGVSIGHFLGYSPGSMFTLAILMASASYVLAPLCMHEVLKSIYKPNRHIANQVVATCMALSVGITLPFNILIGFELYYFMIKGIEAYAVSASIGLALPFVLVIISLLRRPGNKLLDPESYR